MSDKQADLFTTSPPRKPFRFDADAFCTGQTTNAHECSDRATMAGRVASFFRARPNEWVDGRELMIVAGSYGWRTRVSDIRRPPYNMRIDNRQRRVGTAVVSEYMYVPPDSEGLGGVA